MKVLIPMEIKECEGDCPFWEWTSEGTPMCNFEWMAIELPKKGFPEWCPLIKFKQEKE